MAPAERGSAVTVLLTGSAGFIGFHLAQHLLREGHHVVGVDTLTDDYDQELKAARLALLDASPGYAHERVDITDAEGMDRVFAAARPRAVVHLAARAGVRTSMDQVAAYTHTNALGFARVLEAARAHGAGRVIYASSSSVYGDADVYPTPETASCRAPKSPYASTKLANELLAEAVATSGLLCLGLRFFTAYGPWGRPDMAAHLFTEALRHGAPIRLNNAGAMGRDWVYVQDIVDVVTFALTCPLQRHDVWNVGSGECTTLPAFLALLEHHTGRRAVVTHTPLPPGDAARTQADLARLTQVGAPVPHTSLDEGIASFLDWHERYYPLAAEPH